ncbi:GNAT family N-acetyltransferase [Bacillus sp. FJAT-49736]|uniref:GNAT family N-acetyltransferase n=1 Tax=Bacillus sp. FJAT-49736 TaxID=2833582 RepID=UPI001BC92B5D|nr:GNAT family N-acetyltransferase [Bacillus sp. FJAT-49736]MBS4174388.1 GNAT family N-acetyltransferase [Bacillus sp. FJAT-49736]
MIFQKDSLTVRKLEEEDKEKLVKWLSDPRVLEYYEGRDQPHDWELVTDHFYNRKNKEVIGCLVEYEGVEIGYIQFYPIEAEEREEYGYAGLNDVIYGTDQFIGEVDYWGKGIGKLLVHSMIEYLVEEKGADRVVMDPQCWNERAIACYEKCGMKKVKHLPKHEMHEGELRDCWLMEYLK